MHDWLILDRETGVQVDTANSVIMADFMAEHAPWPVAYNPRNGEVLYYEPHVGYMSNGYDH